MFSKKRRPSKSALRVAYRYWPVGAEPRNRSGIGVPSPLDGYNAPYPPYRRLATSFPSIVPVNSQTVPPLSSPPCSLAPVSGAPLASCGATSRPLQSPFCLRPTTTCRQPRVLNRPPFGTLSRRRPATDGDHDGVPEPFRSAPIYRRDAIPPRSAPSLLNSDLPLIPPNLPPNLYL
jgi:hypothetical protein